MIGKITNVAIALLLASCATPGVYISKVDTKTEVLHFVVPNGSTVAHQASSTDIQIVEYLPTGQSLQRWTDMLTVLIMDRNTAPSIDTFFDRMTDTFRLGCAVEPIVFAPVRSMDGSYPAGTQTVICGRSKKFGSGSVVIYKMIEGKYGFYQVQRAWNFPPATKSADILFTQAMRDSAAERLAPVRVCDRALEGDTCLVPPTMARTP